MQRGTNWVIIDTETTGIRSPIFAVEIAAQRMCGWQREGAPFRVLLNHDVEIEPQPELDLNRNHRPSRRGHVSADRHAPD